MTPLALALASAGFALTAWIAVAPAPRAAEVEGRLSGLQGARAPGARSDRGSALRQGLRRSFMQLGSWIEGRLSGWQAVHRLDRALWLAGSQLKAGEFLILCLLTAGMPLLVLKSRLNKIREELSRQLPDALMLLINALKAGNSFLSGLQVVARQLPAPLSTQLAITLSEVNMGLGVEEALLNLQDRVGTVEFELVVSAILVQRETGGNLAEILGNLDETMRDRIRIKGEIHALTAQGRLSGWVLSLLPTGVGFLFFLVNPRYILGLLIDPRGQLMVAGALVSQGIGVLVIRKVVDVRY